MFNCFQLFSTVFIPFLYICFLIGSLSLAGFPYLSGFYSKDLIIEILYLNLEILGIYGFRVINFVIKLRKREKFYYR